MYLLVAVNNEPICNKAVKVGIKAATECSAVINNIWNKDRMTVGEQIQKYG